MRELPIGVQHLSKFIEGDLIYVDKTEAIHRLIKRGDAYFLSRPRRFGKSLLVSTLNLLFQGKKQYFKGTWIEDKWDWSKTNPVIHISCEALSYKEFGLDGALSAKLKECAKEYEIELEATAYKPQFEELIKKLHEKLGKIVLLIDEYDKPLIDFLEYEGLEQAYINQAIMKNFYSTLKSTGDYFRFIFITGVSKFTKVSIFSDLNHIYDISMEREFANLVGYTQQELEFYFADYLQKIQAESGTTYEELMENIKIWYNGFSWDGENKLYNPFGTLLFLASGWFRNYWFATGMPTFLLKQMQKHQLFDVENTSINELSLNNGYDIERLELIPLLFQTGYLTIQSINKTTNEIVLDYPNKEVRESMYAFLINGLANVTLGRNDAHNSLHKLLPAFLKADLGAVRAILDALFATLPYEVYRKKSEGIYHGLIHVMFSLLGIHIKSEVHSARGRADSVVETATHVFIFEFKFNKNATEAIAQIQEKNYAAPFRSSERTIIGIGVNFSTRVRGINGWKEVIL
jgi:Predicted AAA-ATPase/PD-(D/E)XK nuclease superfamily